MSRNKMNRTQLAAHLGVSKGYVSQLLNGEYDHKLSNLIKLSLAFGYVPTLEFRPVAEVLKSDKISSCTLTLSPQRQASFQVDTYIVSEESPLTVPVKTPEYVTDNCNDFFKLSA